MEQTVSILCEISSHIPLGVLEAIHEYFTGAILLRCYGLQFGGHVHAGCPIIVLRLRRRLQYVDRASVRANARRVWIGGSRCPLCCCCMAHRTHARWSATPPNSPRLWRKLVHRWVAHLCSVPSTSVFASPQDLGRNVGALCLRYLPRGLACWKETGCKGWLSTSQRGISAARFGENVKARSKAGVIRPEPIPTDIHRYSDCLVTSSVGTFLMQEQVMLHMTWATGLREVGTMCRWSSSFMTEKRTQAHSSRIPCVGAVTSWWMTSWHACLVTMTSPHGRCPSAPAS